MRSRAILVILATSIATAAPAGAAIPTITRDKIISIAKSGVGCPYVWGGTCWDPNNKSWKGADCSGYVTVCWQIPSASKTTDCLPHYYTTSTFQNSSTHWSNISRSSLIKGDALVYNSGSAGHVILYYSGDKWGNAQVYEARGSAYGIVYRTKYVDSKYVARRRDSIVAPTPTYPKLSIKSSLVTISGQDRDFCKEGTSDGIFDWNAGQTTYAQIDIKNSGTAVGAEVKIGLWAEEPYLKVLKWNIYTDWKQSGSFVLNDTDGMQSIPHDDPGQSFTLNLKAISVGETKRIKLKLKALKFSVGAADHPDIRAWVKSIKDYYTKSSFSATPTNVKSYQTFNGGDLRAYSQTDVLSDEVCDQADNDCDGQTDEDDVCKPAEPDSGPGPRFDDGGQPQTDGGVDPLLPLPPRATPAGGTDALTGGCSVGRGAAPGPWVLLGLVALLAARRQRR